MEKLVDISSLAGLVEILKSNQQKIVFTNGCFDLLHPGHIDYLRKAKSLGDALFVGLNSDTSIKNLKGPKRPINNISDRVIMLSALESIDFVVVFDDETPINLIRQIKPDILVKGGDYSIDTIVGADFVIDYGGIVDIIPFKEGYSSTQLIQKIKEL